MLVCGKSADIIKITATIKIVLLTTTMFAKNKGNGIHKPFLQNIHFVVFKISVIPEK